MHCVGGQRGGHHHSVVGGVLVFSCHCLISALFIGPSLTSNEGFPKNFPPSKEKKKEIEKVSKLSL